VLQRDLIATEWREREGGGWTACLESVVKNDAALTPLWPQPATSRQLSGAARGVP
jgi:hypothetical protein